VLLPQNECQIWIDHLVAVVENRKRGAKKVAETCKKKKKTSESLSNVSHTEPPLSSSSISVVNNMHEGDDLCTYCGKCGEEFGESDDSNELWIGCDLCDKWYHCSCEG